MENALFGMPAFGQEYEVCEVLENIAPNVNEMQLFADDIPEACIGGKCPFNFFPLFQFCFTSPRLGGGVHFLLSPFHPSLPPLPHPPVIGSIFAPLVPRTVRCRIACLSLFGIYSL